jgi:hypothetical protein
MSCLGGLRFLGFLFLNEQEVEAWILPLSPEARLRSFHSGQRGLQCDSTLIAKAAILDGFDDEVGLHK